MGRVPCCEKPGVKKGPWTPEEDHKLVTYIQNHGHTSWRALPKQAGLSRCGKSCRLRWTNYLRPGIKRGSFTTQEENSIIQLHAVLGNRWSTISTHLPGRTDNEIKNHWNTRLRKRMLKMGLDPATHRPWALPHQLQQPLPLQPSQISSLLVSLLQGAPASAPDPAQSPLLNALLLGSQSFSNNNGLFPAAAGHALQNNPRAPAAPPLPPTSSGFPAPAMLDPALLAAAETRLVLDCLKFNSAESQMASSSDHHLNQLLTRLLLLKLLQGSTSNHVAPAPSNAAAACYENRAPFQDTTQHAAGLRMSGPISADQLLQSHGLNLAAVNGLMQAANNRERTAASTPPAPSSAFANSNFCASLSETNHSSTTPNTTPLNMFSSSSYQQRLLQTLPFLAESVIEPSTSAASTDHLSSTSPHQLSQGSFPNCAAELTTHNGSLSRQQTASWLGGSTQLGSQLAQPGSMQRHSSLPGEDNQVLTSGAQLLVAAGGMHDVAGSRAPTLTTWEEHLMMTEQKGGGDRDLASSSTVSSSTLSSGSQGQATPNTPTNIFNIQEYWSNLLNLISSGK